MKTTIPKIFPYLIILILAWVLLAKGCKEPEIRYERRFIEKIKIVKWEKDKDSTKFDVKKRDTVITKIVLRWRDRKADTVFKPCEELILICDSVIVVDSSQIASLKHLNELNDSIISQQKIMLYNDSIDANCFRKEIRRQKRQKALAITGLILVGGAAIVK